MRNLFVVMLILCANAAWASPELDASIARTRLYCGGISDDLNHLKTMAGINTAVTAVGTVTGGVGFGVGMAKAGVDSEIEKLERELEQLKLAMADVPVEKIEIENQVQFDKELTEYINQYWATLQQKEQQLSAAEQKSKTLGNVRTGMLAASTATNIAGTIIAANNRVKGDLKSQIDECLASVRELSNARMQAHVDKSATDAELERADRVVRACDKWATVDINSINGKSTGAAVSSGIGAGLGLAGTITSAAANSDSVRQGDSNKEKSLNSAANVLAGGTTIASGAAVIFNATQINAIKRAAAAAEECEGALR